MLVRRAHGKSIACIQITHTLLTVSIELWYYIFALICAVYLFGVQGKGGDVFREQDASLAFKGHI